MDCRLTRGDKISKRSLRNWVYRYKKASQQDSAPDLYVDFSVEVLARVMIVARKWDHLLVKQIFMILNGLYEFIEESKKAHITTVKIALLMMEKLDDESGQYDEAVRLVKSFAESSIHDLHRFDDHERFNVFCAEGGLEGLLHAKDSCGVKLNKILTKLYNTAEFFLSNEEDNENDLFYIYCKLTLHRLGRLPFIRPDQDLQLVQV